MRAARATSVLVVAVLLAAAARGGGLGLVAVAAIVPALLGRRLGDLAPRPWWDVALVAGLLATPVPFLLGAPPDTAVIGVLLVLLLHQRLSPYGPDGQRAVLAVATLLLVACAAHEPGPGVGLAWAVWLVALPLASGVGGPTRAALVVATVALTLPVFWLLPRPAAPALAWAGEVGPGDIEALRDGHGEVATVRFPGAARPLVLRSSGLTRFDGVRWWAEPARRERPVLAHGEGTPLRVSHVALGGVVLVPPGVVSVDRGVDWQDDADGWHTRSDGDVEVLVTATIDGPIGVATLDPASRALALALPPLDVRVGALTRRVVDGQPTAAARVAAIAREVSTRRYTRDAPDAPDPLAAFLFGEVGGDCELFASSVAVMLRQAGVPARVAIGFTGGVVEGADLRFTTDGAHAWAEAHLDGVGWVPVDATAPESGATAAGGSPPAPPGAGPEAPPDGAPTGTPLAPGASPDATPRTPPDAAPAGTPAAPAPAASWRQAARSPVASPPLPPRGSDPIDALWHSLVLDWDRTRQAEVLTALTRAVGAVGALLSAIAAGVGLLGVLSWVRARRRVRTVARRTGVAGAWDDAVRALARAGWVAPDGLPPVDTAAWLHDRLGAPADALVRLAWLHAEVAFGGADEAGRRDEARALAERVVAAAAALERGTGDDPGTIPGAAPRPPTRL